MKIRTTILMTVVVIALSAIAAIGQQAPPVEGEAVQFGLHTLADRQSMRLSLVNRLPQSIRDIVPCVRVQINFDVYEVAGDGSVRLLRIRSTQRTITLDPGEAASYDFSPLRSPNERIDVSIFAVPVEGTFDPLKPVRGTLTSNLSVRQAGFTIFNLPGTIRGFNPQPDPPRD